MKALNLDPENVDDYVRLSEDGGDTIVEVDPTGGGENYTTVVTLQGTTGLDADDLLDDGSLDLSNPFG